MKKIVIFSEESIVSGCVKCGISEVVDSLANSLTSDYSVSVVCVDGNGKMGRTAIEFREIEPNVQYGRFLQVDYYLIKQSEWPALGIDLTNRLAPDIFHNFYIPSVIEGINLPSAKKVFTFDDGVFLKQTEILLKYDYITSFSKGYVDMVLENMEIEDSVREKIRGTSIGVLDQFFCPEKGLFIPAPYDCKSQEDKVLNKLNLLSKEGIDDTPCVFLTMCRLIKEKGIEQIIQNLDFFKKNNCLLIIIGRGDKEYEEQLSSLTLEDGVLFSKGKVEISQMLPYMAAADFYLQPSLKESGGITPMVSALYGAIPIVTQAGGLKDNFNEENAIIVENNLAQKLEEALKIYSTDSLLREKRKKAMMSEFGWTTRKKQYIELYES